MFKKVLIANRGEIALRIIRACKELGVKTVALCPQPGEEDNFLETKLADEFYYLDSIGVSGYLDQKKIIQIAKKAKAEAIHPGYGFLSENGDFADLCEKNKIKFIGPSGEILRKLGNKIEAKKIAKKVGLPLIAGTEKKLTKGDLIKIVKKIGPPFILKAADGGGGIGIELFREIDKKKIIEVFEKLKKQVKHTFGSEIIFIEKFIENPRHVEFQILGDGKGKVIHLGERECSVQRRNQKLIEEAPSPFVDEKLRKKMGKAVIKLGEYLKYKNAGTVEFLVDRKKNFYFLEVNPRVQVEHPVTELITGVDIVENQLRIASEGILDLKQKNIRFSGWAMEFRINAEEALEGFKPKTGIVTQFSPPLGKGVEVHTFCHPTQEILPYFDNLLAKLVVFGKDREMAIKRAKRALDEFIIEGVPTLIPFYRQLLQNENFKKGEFSTSFIEENKSSLLSEIKIPEVKLSKGFLLSPEEIASIVATLYQVFQEKIIEKEKQPKINKWVLSERLKMFGGENTYF